MQNLYNKLSQSEFQALKEFVFDYQKKSYHRKSLVPINTLSLGVKRSPESIKVMNDWLVYLLRQCENGG